MFQFEFNPITGNLDYVLNPVKLQESIIDSIIVVADYTGGGDPVVEILTDETSVLFTRIDCI